MKQIDTRIISKALTKKSGADFEERREALFVKLGLLDQLSGLLVQQTRFGLADQVLTHALANVGLTFKLRTMQRSLSALEQSIQDITLERYGLSLAAANKKPRGEFLLSAGKIGSDGLAGLLLRDWSQEDLVQYILDHEVPVNPKDMPGANRIAA